MLLLLWFCPFYPTNTTKNIRFAGYACLNLQMEEVGWNIEKEILVGISSIKGAFLATWSRDYLKRCGGCSAYGAFTPELDNPQTARQQHPGPERHRRRLGMSTSLALTLRLQGRTFSQCLQEFSTHTVSFPFLLCSWLFQCIGFIFHCFHGTTAGNSFSSFACPFHFSI